MIISILLWAERAHSGLARKVRDREREREKNGFGPAHAPLKTLVNKKDFSLLAIIEGITYILYEYRYLK